jgi:hypothetical protein
MSGGNIYWSDIQPHFQAMSQRLEAIENQLVLLSDKAGIPFTPMNSDVPEEIKQLVRDGKTLEALTAYRALHPDMDIKEARAAVASL